MCVLWIFSHHHLSYISKQINTPHAKTMWFVSGKWMLFLSTVVIVLLHLPADIQGRAVSIHRVMRIKCTSCKSACFRYSNQSSFYGYEKVKSGSGAAFDCRCLMVCGAWNLISIHKHTVVIHSNRSISLSFCSRDDRLGILLCFHIFFVKEDIRWKI